MKADLSRLPNKTVVACTTIEELDLFLSTDPKNNAYDMNLDEDTISIYLPGCGGIGLVPLEGLRGGLNYHNSESGIQHWGRPISLNYFLTLCCGVTSLEVTTLEPVRHIYERSSLVTYTAAPYNSIYIVESTTTSFTDLTGVLCICVIDKKNPHLVPYKEKLLMCDITKLDDMQLSLKIKTDEN